MAEQALAGIRIVDLTRLLPGPLCTQHLAELGAEVIKVEELDGGDYARRGLGAGSAGNGYFETVNRGKRSLALDLKQPSGRALFLRLAATADVVVEAFRPGVAARLGIGYEDLRPANRRLVYCSITGYGQQGPLAARAGHDVNYCGYAGVLAQTGPAGGAPVIPAFQIADLAGGTLTATTAILAALVGAQRRGEGCHLDVAMADSVLANSVFALTQSAAAQRPGQGPLTGGLPCYAVYRTADSRYFALGALEEKFWARFCAAVGHPEWVALHGAEGEDRESLRAALAALFRSRTREHWTQLLEPADCCASPVLEFAEALRHPQFRDRGVVIEREGRVLGLRLRFGSEARPAAAAPALGEHTRAVLREIGCSEREIESLREQGVVATG